jgi:protoporphyrinogen/coproporphyrinogen III oxidase
MPHIVVVGAGISGLALAYRLQQTVPDAKITVLEQDARPGGKIWTHRQDGFQVELGPNGFLDTKPATRDLCEALGLGHRLVPASDASGKKRYLLLGGKLRLLPDGLVSFLTSDVLSWRGKLALLGESYRRRPRPRAEESVDRFARRRAGAEVADVLADAVVTGIYAGDPKLLSLPAAFPRLDALERQYGSVLKGFTESGRRRRTDAAARAEADRRPGALWSFREGLRLLVETLRQSLTQPPLLGVSVRRIEKRLGAGWIVHGAGNDQWTADALVLACPAYAQAALLAEVDTELAERAGAIAYNRVAVIALGYRQADVPVALDGFGYIVPQRTRRDLLGVQWCSSIFPERAPAGAVLLRALAGGWHRPDVVGWTDERLLDAMRAELRVALRITVAPVFHHIVRWDRAIPQYHLGHLERIAWIAERLRRHAGLFLAGNAYHGVALNDCTEQAVLLAAQIKDYLTKKDVP